MNTANQHINKSGHTSRKKILIMGHIDGIGGAQTAFHRLYDFIQGEGYIVKVITMTDSKTKNQPFERKVLVGRIAHKGPIITLRIRKVIGLIYSGARALLFRPDIFVCVGLNNSANLIAHFLGDQCFKIGQDFIASRSINDNLWHSSRAVFNGIGVQAPSMLDYWRLTGVNIKGINWLPCFPEQPVTGVIHTKRTASEDVIRLSYFGRLASNKGLTLLFQALASPCIPKKVTLDLWGKGAEEIPLRKLTLKLGLEERIRFLGSYPAHEEGAKLMASYDALVLCSTEMEGLPLVLIEGMAYGLPFLTTDVGAIRDCCIDNPDSVLVSPTQEGIIQGLRILIERIKAEDFDPIRLQNFYDQKFSYKVMAARWQACFQNPKDFFYEQDKNISAH